ncbi:uncharacterized protein [Clytia hemisphaerica]|uniref:uncharacterized protein n=1 Tax=Clytia hemisphaerica TaxID=252671 RepID=UPI0034D7112A
MSVTSEAGDQISVDLKIARLRRKRGGKKGSITKRINLSEEIMKMNGSHELDVNKPPYQLATWFVQQGLPRIRIPWFDGTPSSYVEFVTSFRDLVHNQGYLTTLQKCIYLHQAVRGEVKRSIQGFRNDHEGYVLALRRIKKNDDRKDHRDHKGQRDSRNGQGQGKQNQSQDNGHRSNWSGKIGDGKGTGQQGTKTKSKDNKSSNKCYLCKDEYQIQPERFEMAKKLNLCYNCLKKDHFTSKCKSKNNCFNAGCDERHHTRLHEYFTEHVKESFSGNTQVVEPSGTVYPSVVPVKLQGLDSSSITTCVLLDTGSQSTVRDDVAKKLKLKKKDKKITITTINDIGTKTKVKETSMRSNVPSVHIPLEVKEGENSEPLAIKIIFGWTLFGASGQPEMVSMNRIVIKPEADLHHCVQRIWDQDFIPNPSDRDEALSIEDKLCHERLESETVLADGKYQVPIPMEERSNTFKQPYCDRENIPPTSKQAEKRTKPLKALRPKYD